MLYRIVAKSNYDLESFSEYWINGPAMTHEHAKQVAKLFNDNSHPQGDTYYKAEPINYQLYKFEP